VQVNLSWADVPGALFYRVYRGTSTGGPYQLIGQSNPNPMQSSNTTPATTNYQDGPGNLVNGISYFYVVSTVTVDGESSYSTEFAANAPSQPASPAGLTGVVV
jgi:hypothetical protein